jgi:Spy/CpxP family protein refolding chaperone
MKKLLIALIALITVSVTANAQTGAAVERRPKVERTREALRRHHHRKIRKHRRHHRMAQQLNLSEQQKMQASLYKADFKKKMTELNSNEKITVKEQRDRKASLLKEKHAKMESLLTPEQKNKMAQLKADHKAKGEQHDAARMDKMKSKLQLTDTQVAQMKTQRESMMTKLKAIKENNSMDRTAKKEKLQSLKEEMKQENKKIFTEEQLKKMEEWKKERAEKQSVK